MNADTTKKRKLHQEEEDDFEMKTKKARATIDLKWMIEWQLPVITSYLNYYDVWYLRRTCHFMYYKLGHLEQRLYKDLKYECSWDETPPPLIDYALTNGYMDQVQYLEEYDMASFKWEPRYFLGTLKTILWARGRNAKLDLCDFKYALKCKDPRVMPWLMKQMRVVKDLGDHVGDALEENRIDILEQFQDVGYKFAKSDFKYALVHSGVQVLQFLLDQECKIPSSIIRYIAGTTIEKVEWVIKECDPSEVKIKPGTYHKAAESDDVRIISTLYDHFGGELTPELYFYALKPHPNVDIFQWLWDKGVPMPTGVYDEAIDYAVSPYDGHYYVEVIEWLIHHGMPRTKNYMETVIDAREYPKRTIELMDLLYSHGFPIPKPELVANPTRLSPIHFKWIVNKMSDWSDQEYNAIESHMRHTIRLALKYYSLEYRSLENFVNCFDSLLQHDLQ
jgi:hypothetical protein